MAICSVVSSSTCPSPRGVLRTKHCVLVHVLILRSQVLGLVLEIKSSATIPRTLINSIH